MTLDGADQFRLLHPISAASAGLVADHPAAGGGTFDGTQIVGITSAPMVAVLAVAVAAGGGGHGPHGVPAPPRVPLRAVASKAYSAIGANIDTAIFIVDRGGAPSSRPSSRTPRTSSAFRPRDFVPNRAVAHEAYANVAAIVHSGAGDSSALGIRGGQPGAGPLAVVAHDGAVRDVAEREKYSGLLALPTSPLITIRARPAEVAPPPPPRTPTRQKLVPP